MKITKDRRINKCRRISSRHTPCAVHSGTRRVPATLKSTAKAGMPEPEIDNPDVPFSDAELENVELEVRPLVVAPRLGIVVLPVEVIDRDLHFRRIAVVEVVGAAVIVRAPEVLRVVDVGIVVEAVPVLGGVALAPLLAEGLLRWASETENRTRIAAAASSTSMVRRIMTSPLARM